MAKNLTLKCAQCGKDGQFADTIEITQSKWTVIGWNMAKNEPYVTCPDCDYHGIIDEKKKNKRD